MKSDEFTIGEHMLDVGHKHQLHIQDWGNEKAKKPIIFLHGGPGGQCKDKHETTTAQALIYEHLTEK